MSVAVPLMSHDARSHLSEPVIRSVGSTILHPLALALNSKLRHGIRYPSCPRSPCCKNETDRVARRNGKHISPTTMIV